MPSISQNNYQDHPAFENSSFVECRSSIDQFNQESKNLTRSLREALSDYLFDLSDDVTGTCSSGMFDFYEPMFAFKERPPSSVNSTVKEQKADGITPEQCVYGIDSFTAAFLYSIETQVTIGY